MSSASFFPARGPRGPRGSGSTAVGPETGHHRHLLGDALRAIKVFVEAALRVVLFGEYTDREWPKTRRR